MSNDASDRSQNHPRSTTETCRRSWHWDCQFEGALPCCRGIGDRGEKLHALKKVQLDADIVRLRGNLASVPVAHVVTMENAIRQMERDLKELARK